MITTNTQFTAKNMVEITKEEGPFAFTTVIALRKNHVIAFNNHMHVSYVYEGSSDEEACIKFLSLIEEIMEEPIDGKYFACPEFDEHCKNGVPNNKPKEFWERLAKDIIQEAINTATAAAEKRYRNASNSDREARYMKYMKYTMHYQ